jgi:hypothetical protein
MRSLSFLVRQNGRCEVGVRALVGTPFGLGIERKEAVDTRRFVGQLGTAGILISVVMAMMPGASGAAGGVTEGRGCTRLCPLGPPAPQ